MAKIIIAGSSVVLKSVKLDVLKKLAKYSPAALEKRDEKDRLTFKISIAGEGTGSIAEKGVFFAPVTHDADGLATVTMPIPTNVSDAKEWAADKLANVFNQLTAMEAAIVEESKKVDEAKKAMLEQIVSQ